MFNLHSRLFVLIFIVIIIIITTADQLLTHD